MDKVRLLSKVVPQLSHDPLWEEFFEVVADLAESGEIVESPFKDALRKRGFLKEFMCPFSKKASTPVGTVGPDYNLPEGTYYCPNLVNPKTLNHYFTESATALLGTAGVYPVTCINFSATDFISTYLKVIGPGTFSLHSLATLMQAAYLCGAELEDVSFDGSGYFVEYVIGGLHSEGQVRTGTNEFYTVFPLIPYNDASGVLLGDIIIPKKKHQGAIITESERTVISYSNGVAAITPGSPTFPEWIGTFESGDVDLLTVRRYFNGYQFGENKVNIIDLTLKKWFDQDAPIAVSAEIVAGFAVSPLFVTIDFIQGAVGGVSMSGNQIFTFNLLNFDTSKFRATIDGYVISEGRSYRAPVALLITTNQENTGDTPYTCSLDVISEGVTYTVYIAQEPAGCVVDVTSLSQGADRVLSYSSVSTVDNPMYITKNVSTAYQEEPLTFAVKSSIPFKIRVEFQARSFPSVIMQDEAYNRQWETLEWEANPEVDGVVNQFISYQSGDGFVHPESLGQNQFSASVTLPGFNPQVFDQGDTMIQSVYIYVGTQKILLVRFTANSKHLENVINPLRVLGGVYFECITKNAGTGFVAIGSERTYLNFHTSGTYTRSTYGILYETGRYIDCKNSFFNDHDGTKGVALLFDIPAPSCYDDYKIYMVGVPTDPEHQGEWEVISGWWAWLENQEGIVIADKDSFQGGTTYSNYLILITSLSEPTQGVGSAFTYYRYRKIKDLEQINNYWYANGRQWEQVVEVSSITDEIENSTIQTPAGISGIIGAHTDLSFEVMSTDADILRLHKNSSNRYYAAAFNDKAVQGQIGNHTTKTIVHQDNNVLKLTCDNVVTSQLTKYGHLYIQIPADSILILCGFGTANFGTGSVYQYTSPFTFVANQNWQDPASDLSRTYGFPRPLLDRAQFDNDDYQQPNAQPWKALRQTQVIPSGATSVSGQKINPRGTWTCWYSETVMAYYNPYSIPYQEDWRDKVVLQMESSTWFGSSARIMHFYGIIVSAATLTEAQKLALQRASFGDGRYLYHISVYSPIKLSSEPFTANDRAANNIIMSLLDNETITPANLVDIPLNLQVRSV